MMKGPAAGAYLLALLAVTGRGRYRTRADWEAWHQDPQFAATRRRLDGLENGPAEHWWHEVVLDVRKYEGAPRSGSKQVLRKRTAKTAKSKAKTKKTRRR